MSTVYELPEHLDIESSSEESDKPTFCLVHGAWHCAQHWGLLRPELEALGYPTIAPNLPIDDPDANFNDYAEVVVNEIRRSGVKEVILVGHSRSGNVIPRVPQMVAKEIGGVAIINNIYVAATIDPKTMGWLPLAELGSLTKKGILYEIGANHTPHEELIFNKELAKEAFYHDCPDNVTDWAFSLWRPQNRPAVQPIIDSLPKVPSNYLVCTNDRVISAYDQALIAPNAFRIPASQVDYIKTGHSPMLANPWIMANKLTGFLQAAQSQPDLLI